MEHQWVIVISNGRTYLGRMVFSTVLPHDEVLDEAGDLFYERVTLSPVYDFAVSVERTPQGAAIHRMARPTLMYGTIERLSFMHPTVITKEQLTPNDYRELEKMAAAAEEAKKEIRAASIGLTLASTIQTGRT